MERANGQQEAALETAALPTLESQRQQHRIQAPSYIIPRDPRLQVSSLADTQPRSTPAQLLRPGSAAAAASVEREQEQPEGSNLRVAAAQGGREALEEVEEQSQRQCSHCGSPDPAGSWWRHPTTRAWLCNACGWYAKRNSGSLPSTAVLQRRAQLRQVVAASKLRHVPPSQRQCLQCGASSPGAGQHWRRHPATKEEWLCPSCYTQARIQLKRKRQHKAAATASSSDGGEETWEECEEAQPPSQLPPAPQQQAAPVPPTMPGPPVQHSGPEAAARARTAGARQQQQQQQHQQQQQPMLPAPAQPPPPPQQPHPQQQQSLYELLMAAAAQPAGAAAGLTPELAACFIILLPLQADQEVFLRDFLLSGKYRAAAAYARAALCRAGILLPAANP